MAYKSSHEHHHHFPKLAEESGFSFNTHRSRVHIDWSKIRLINIENLIRERKFIVIEQHLNDILDCVLESEFDVRILDEGVMKMFRLAQLTIEYQQFCRHYLDHSVYVLREEISSLTQELDTTKKEIREKDEQIKKLRRRMRQTLKTPLPYGNGNIASMILKTFASNNDVFLPSSNAGEHHYNKCTYCDKVFLNQLYLQSHMTRRHNNILTDSPKKDEQDNQQILIENVKLGNEILELKTKLKEMEVMITNKNGHNDPVTKKLPKNDIKDDCEPIIVKETKDAEVATNNGDYLLNKIEEWKKEEHDKYTNEINMLRNQIMDTINSFKHIELQKPVLSDIKLVDQLQTTIIQQGAEILDLKKEIEISRITTEKENAEKKKQAEAQILLWAKRTETQSKQYELLLQKLNEVAKDSQESRALAESEKERSAHLQFLLEHRNLNTTTSDVTRNTNNHAKISREKSIEHKPNSNDIQKSNHIKKSTEKIKDRKYLEHLHRKAQELLDIGSTGSSSSDFSSVKLSTKEIQDSRIQKKKLKSTNARDPELKSNHVKDLNIGKPHKPFKIKEKEFKKVKPKLDPETTTVENTIIPSPESPMKVVRAKLVEEVNKRLVAAGVDPLKNGIPQNIFQKQKRQLLIQHELKSKKNPEHEKVRHSILTYLDSSTTNVQKEVTQMSEYISPRKLNKPLRNLTSVISNVKNKALSLVKLNEANIKDKRKSLNSKVTKRAMSLIKTPPGSTTSSPLTQRNSPLKIVMAHNSKETKAKNKIESKNIDDKNKNSHVNDMTERDEDSDSENTSTESDHKYYNSSSIIQQSSKSIENLIKSPVQRPTSANLEYNHNHTVNKYTIDSGDNNITQTQSETYITELKPKLSKLRNNSQPIYNENSSDDVESLSGVPFKKVVNDENIENNMKQTKSVLKNASSTSSLNKKKVLFDMDAIQMKSVSASPSQSTEKSDGKENYELGIVNLDGEEWDLSSIENEVLKNDTKIQINTRTSPKIAELKQTIESQLARRNVTSSTTLVGGVDVLAGPIPRAASVGGSNTSLGSSILDISESIPVVNHIAYVKPKKVTQNDDSDIDISEFSIDGIGNKH